MRWATLAVEVVIDPGGRRVRVEGPVKVSNLLEALDLTPDEAVVILGDRPVPESAVIPDGATVRVIRVLSGG